MSAFVVDENVPIVANDGVRAEPKAPQADVACRLACIQTLKKVAKSGVIIIDNAGEILERYRRHLHGRGQPGVGDAFFKHVSDHQFDRRKVRRIALRKNQHGEFKTFPTGAKLVTFDPSDRVFVALALAALERPTILNAVDSDYSDHRTALEENGVHVKEICPHCVRNRQGR